MGGKSVDVREANDISGSNDRVVNANISVGAASSEGTNFGNLHGNDIYTTSEVVGERVDVAMVFKSLKDGMRDTTVGELRVGDGPFV